ncbi:MAG TPA: MBOAT family O-acyltransferase [Candidatus Acidoferrales bacterium]|nr:MBOAT family O-acyltransferase [Candidatus Acidoferrales bacterium]
MPFKLVAYALGCLISLGAAIFVRSVRLRQLLLLAVSYSLYLLWGPWFLGILLLSSVVNYFLGAYLRRRITQGRLWLGIVFNLILLGTFKYLPELASSSFPFWALHSLRQLVLPLGISFWTFQALSYLFDIYREEELDPSFLEFCLYMAFWPTVISGPICRLTNMLPQFRSEKPPLWQDYGIGLQRIGTGFLMLGLAQLLADGLAPGQGINAAFNRVNIRWSGLDAWTLAIGYGFQLFMDFAGYSHLVIGAARLFGFELQENFDRPYLSVSPSVFWTRWHMSLSFWIRDYVFLPLASLRRGLLWRNFTLLIAMILFGLWHRGSLLFVVWGAYQGILLILHRQWQQIERRAGMAFSGIMSTALGWAYTFAVISLGWIVFRANSRAQAWSMVSAIFSARSYFYRALPDSMYLLVITIAIGYFCSVAVGKLLDGLAAANFSSPRCQAIAGMISKQRWVWIAPLAIIVAVYVFAIAQTGETVSAPMLYRLF